MKKCSNGHYYDPKKSKYCPYCKIDIDIEVKNNTEPKKKRGLFGRKNSIKKQNFLEESKTVLWEDENKESDELSFEANADILKPILDIDVSNESEPETSTSKLEETKLQTGDETCIIPLPVGWLVQSYNGVNQDYPLRVGMNYIYIKADTLSVLYNKIDDNYLACIIYDPLNISFHIKTLNNKVFLNNVVVDKHIVLDGRSTIKLDYINTQFIPLCGRVFSW
ncbi:MAG: hypothetical protein CVU98_07155 [Firmicutes bacterium HGW-Firmicutes-3]|jgi:hypothetical protein|nr:MAG: hypothetical protein CVU98_07155 [Firmicutes bacterium HGW-Firmicutes-3]